MNSTRVAELTREKRGRENNWGGHGFSLCLCWIAERVSGVDELYGINQNKQMTKDYLGGGVGHTSSNKLCRNAGGPAAWHHHWLASPYIQTTTKQIQIIVFAPRKTHLFWSKKYIWLFSLFLFFGTNIIGC